MKLIKPYYEILTPINGDEILKTIERVARTCYKSEDKINEDSAQKITKSLIEKHHEAMIEFYDIIVKFVCDRGVSHEIVRHRLASYAQESTRYCNYSKDKFDNQITFVIPCWCNTIIEGDENNQKDVSLMDFAWLSAMQHAEFTYNQLIKPENWYPKQPIASAWQPQQARAVLPNSLKTEINVKMNLREWRHFFKLRTSPAAHPQMREITIPLLIDFKNKIPIIFDDIIV
jgi:thymidylate synthase (FAD)